MLELNYMVLPDDLKQKAFVRDAVLFQVTDPEHPVLNGILGESGKRLAKAGMRWLFNEKLAKILIDAKAAVKVIL